MPSTDQLTAIILVPGDCVDLRQSLLRNKLLPYTWFLIEDGYEVKFLVSRSDHENHIQIAGRGLPVITLNPAEPPASQGPMSPVMLQARRVYETLKCLPQPTKLVACSRDGLPYYVLNAQRQGLGFLNTSCEIVASEPKELLSAQDGTFPDSFQETAASWMEKITIQLANHVFYHNDTLKNWLTKNREQARAISSFDSSRIPRFEEFDGPKTQPASDQTMELVFAGGLTRRNGLIHLLRSLTDYQTVEADFTLTFIGKRQVHRSIQPELDYFLDNTQIICQFLDYANKSHELYKYLNHSSRIVVSLPTLGNSTWPVDLAYSHSLPAITTTYKDRSDYIADNQTLFLTSLHPCSIHQTILGAVSSTNTPANTESRCSHPENFDAQSSVEESEHQFKNIQPVKPSDISVCISHYCRPEYLTTALQSLVNQSIKGFEVIVVDDGSPDEFQSRLSDVVALYKDQLDLKLIRQENSYLGASRNTAWTNSNGQYVLFMDDDNIAVVNELETFALAAAYTNDDILTCFSDTFTDSDFNGINPVVDKRVTPIGACLSLGVLFNCFGDSNSFWKKSTLRSIDGFTELVGIGKEDNEIFARAALQGYKLSVVPEPLFYYRLSKDRMRHHHINPEAGTHRVLETYRNSGDAYTTEIMSLMVGQHKKIQHLERKLHQANVFAERTKSRLNTLNSLLNSDEVA